ncbi:MAG TPA: M20/M25/M40 family metallo-hydrolase, partial [Candidatus Thermoplasmatota archaeon]|nr:M20/M25/M40 family metallo-hydrolase [Candidatus Thermoplasmatota archaeon]
MDPAPLLSDLLRAARHGPEAVLVRVAEALPGFARRDAGPPTAALLVRGAPRVLLSGHVDVVPAGAGWTRDPHGGEVAEGRVWGRGACDMLGSVACFVAAARRAPDAPCGILLTTDEETGMAAASRALEAGL